MTGSGPDDEKPAARCRTVRSLASSLVLAALLALASRPASALVFQSTAAMNAGLGAGQSFLNAEAQLIVSLSNGSQSGCSGSLLAGGAYILTAAHCVTGDSDNLTTSSVSINFANVGITLTSSSYIVDPGWNGNVNNGGDLALISLATPVTSITGYTLDESSSVVGATVTLAGYGLTGTGTSGANANTFGTLYFGTNVYLGTYANIPSVYDYGFNATGAEKTMIAPGDSGGAALLNVGGVWEIVGVHDFNACLNQGCTPNSSYGTYGGDSSVYADSAFLNSVLQVPEPASLALVAAGLVAAVSARRRAKSRSSAP